MMGPPGETNHSARDLFRSEGSIKRQRCCEQAARGSAEVALTIVDVLSTGLEPAVALVYAHAVVIVGFAFSPQLRGSKLVVLRCLRLIVPEPGALAVRAGRDGVAVVLLPAA